MAIQAAEAIDEMYVDNDYNDNREAHYQQERNTCEELLLIQQAQDRVHRLKRVLKRIIRRQQYNYEASSINNHDNREYEIWDAREHLRQAAMEAGNGLKEPLKEPTGVRAAETITTALSEVDMGIILFTS